MQEEIDNEKRAAEFLEFVASNMARLKRNLKKNVTYDPWLFEDSFMESVTVCAEKIRGGAVVRDFENYLFMVSRNRYRKEDNDRRKMIAARADPGLASEIPDSEDTAGGLPDCRTRCRMLAGLVSRNFSERECSLWLQYMADKADGKESMKRLADQTGQGVRDIQRCINRINRYVKSLDPRRMTEKENVLF